MNLKTTQALLITTVVFATIILAFIGFHEDKSNNNPNYRMPPPIARWNDRRKKILFTTQPHHHSKNWARLHVANRMCSRCIFTQDQKEWNSSDAILFNGRFLNKKPPYRLHDQIWIYFHREAVISMPQVEKNILKVYRGIFNWTLTFRRDSDIFFPYQAIEFKNNSSKPSGESEFANGSQTFRKKKSSIAWIVSNCHSSSKREKLIAALSKHVPVDIYGGCGKHKCAKDRSKSVGTDCRKEISKNYKFYLAAENSLCEDYVTEKFFDSTQTDMVPIVYGGANYSTLGLPEKSFINIADFDTVKALADYIKWLEANPEEYNKYLEKKPLYKLSEKSLEYAWCDICTLLWQNYSNSYADIYEWWMHPANGRPGCFPAETLPIMKHL